MGLVGIRRQDRKGTQRILRSSHADLAVEDKVIVEIKALEAIAPVLPEGPLLRRAVAEEA